MAREIKHTNSFELTISTEVYGEHIDLKRIMELCRVIDAYSSSSKVESHVIVSVRLATPEYLIIRFDPRHPITYFETLGLVEKLLDSLKTESGTGSLFETQKIEWVLNESPAPERPAKVAPPSELDTTTFDEGLESTEYDADDIFSGQ